MKNWLFIISEFFNSIGKTSQKRFTTEAQRKNFIVSCACGATNDKS